MNYQPVVSYRYYDFGRRGYSRGWGHEGREHHGWSYEGWNRFWDYGEHGHHEGRH